MLDYNKMLNKAEKDLPEVVHIKQRFEIPNVTGHIQGSNTMVSNITQIASVLGRKVEHLIKFLLKELATPGKLKKNKTLILGSKIPSKRINKKIRQYAEEFVLCPTCGKPDTILEKEKGATYLRCTACGERVHIRTLM